MSPAFASFDDTSGEDIGVGSKDVDSPFTSGLDGSVGDGVGVEDKIGVGVGLGDGFGDGLGKTMFGGGI